MKVGSPCREPMITLNQSPKSLPTLTADVALVKLSIYHIVVETYIDAIIYTVVLNDWYLEQSAER